MNISDLLARLGVSSAVFAEGDIEVATPIDSSPIGRVRTDTPAEIDVKIARAEAAFAQWREVPAPRRGELVRQFGEELRRCKNDLGRLVSIECGKVISEGLGEVQEMIDICDFATGLSRQLYGLTIASERPGHHMREMWQPLGVVGIISAFNFPVAVWSWNAALALVCGNSIVWKPSEKTPLTALACQAIFDRVAEKFTGAPEHLSQVTTGARAAGEKLVGDSRVALVSATGSTTMGRVVGARVAQRFGRSILELGGNNAAIVAPSADLELTVRAICFAAAGTCGQRCTSLRRLIAHEDVYDALLARLKTAYESFRIGDPLDEATLIGPLIDESAFSEMQAALTHAKDAGGTVTGGERAKVTPGYLNAGFYVKPAIVEMPAQTDIVKRETFAPILYAMRYKTFEEAIALQNDVTQGLSSCVFTRDMLEGERFLSAVGSDCGIANVNIGPSGAEIGGAFGGEKETGGGRESGSDAWKAYMRRQTQTVNWSSALPLAQGVKFDV